MEPEEERPYRGTGGVIGYPVHSDEREEQEDIN
jgi:hypothetical protein